MGQILRLKTQRLKTERPKSEQFDHRTIFRGQKSEHVRISDVDCNVQKPYNQNPIYCQIRMEGISVLGQIFGHLNRTQPARFDL